MDVSVIVPACNQGDWVRTTVPLMKESLSGLSFEILVIDDHSTDGCCHGLDRDVVVLHPRQRIGCTAARQMAIDQSRGEVLVLSDPHCEYGEDALAALAKLAAKDEALYQPMMNGRKAVESGFAGAILSIGKRGLILRRRKTPAEFPCLWGSIYAVRRDILDSLGGWPVLPGVWGAQEQAVSLLFWALGVRIEVAQDHLCRHISYQINRKFPYSMPQTDFAGNCHWVHAAFFPATYRGFWRPMLVNNFGDDPQYDALLKRRDFRKFAQMIASKRVKTEEQAFDELLHTPYPSELAKPARKRRPKPVAIAKVEAAQASDESEERIATGRDYDFARPRQRACLQWFLRALPGCIRGRKILDLGARDGFTVNWLAQRLPGKVEGVELVPRQAKWASEKRGQTIRQGNMTQLADADDTWDITTAIHVFQHVNDANKALAEMARVTRPRGWLYVVIPIEENPTPDESRRTRFADTQSILDFIGLDRRLVVRTREIGTYSTQTKGERQELRLLIAKKGKPGSRPPLANVQTEAPSQQLSIIRCDTRAHRIVSAQCRKHLMSVMPRSAHLVDFNQNEEIKQESRNVFVNLMASLNQCRPGLVFVCEYDCLYHPDYFRVDVDREAVNVSFDCLMLDRQGYWPRKRAPASTICGEREYLREVVWQRLTHWGQQRALLDRPVAGSKVTEYTLDVPIIDIRHGENFTGQNRGVRTGEHSADHPYWGHAPELYQRMTTWDHE